MTYNPVKSSLAARAIEYVNMRSGGAWRWWYVWAGGDAGFLAAATRE
jgi:hypothetical protein